MDHEEQHELEVVNPGQQWAQRLGVFGGIAVLLFSLVFVLTMLASGPEKLDYTPAHDTAYYAAHPDVLQAELSEQVLPHVEGVEFTEISGDKLVVGIRTNDYIETRAVIIDLFDRSLFIFEEE